MAAPTISPEMLQQLIAARAAPLAMDGLGAGTLAAAGAGTAGMLIPSSIGQEDYSANANSGNIDIPHLPLKGNPSMIDMAGSSQVGTGAMPPAMLAAIRARLQQAQAGVAPQQQVNRYKISGDNLSDQDVLDAIGSGATSR